MTLRPLSLRPLSLRRLFARLACLFWPLVTTLLGPAALAAPCDLAWLLTPQLGSAPRHLDVSLRFDAGNRTHTVLRLYTGWQGVDEPGAGPTGARLQTVAGDPTARRVDHAAGEAVVLRWRLRPPPGNTALQWGTDWLALLGQAVLAAPETADDGRTLNLCVAVDGLPADSQHLASVGQPTPSSPSDAADSAAATPGRGTRLAWQWRGSVAQAQAALYAAGALQAHARQAQGQALRVVLPAHAGFTQGSERLADAAAAVVAAQRRFWRDGDAPPLTLMVLPAPPGTAPEGSALDDTLLLLLPTDTPASGPAASADAAAQPDAAFSAALVEALLRQRLPDRLGPRVFTGQRDEALRAWLGEGLVAFYTHRLLLHSGAWTPGDYAAALNQRIARYLASPAIGADNLRVASGWATDPALATLPSARGEWLALRWHAALRAAGQPGLDAVLRRLMLPTSQARRSGPLSAPLASHRLLAALRHGLGSVPMHDLAQFIDRGQPFTFHAETLGPCFRMETVPLAEWRLGFDRRSLASGVLQGVEPGGPAAAAGLRDGMRLRGHSVVVGDVQQPVELQVEGDGGSLRSLRYTAAGPVQGVSPQYLPVARALAQPACLGWLNGDAQAPAAAGDVAGAEARAVASANGTRAGSRAGTRAGSREDSRPTRQVASQPTGKVAGKSKAKAAGKAAAQTRSKTANTGKPRPSAAAAGRSGGQASQRATKRR